MGKKYLLGIDNGGTYSKAALFDLHGNQVEKRSIQIPVYAPKVGYTQRKMGQPEKYFKRRPSRSWLVNLLRF